MTDVNSTKSQHPTPVYVVGFTASPDLDEASLQASQAEWLSFFSLLLGDDTKSASRSRFATEFPCFFKKWPGIKDIPVQLLLSLNSPADFFLIHLVQTHFPDRIQIRCPLHTTLDSKRYSELVKNLPAYIQKPDFETLSPWTFEVLLRKDDFKKQTQNDPTSEKTLTEPLEEEERKRAANEYIAVFCNILLVHSKSSFEGLDETDPIRNIIRAKLEGPTPNLLTIRDNLFWPHVGPVFFLGQQNPDSLRSGTGLDIQFLKPPSTDPVSSVSPHSTRKQGLIEDLVINHATELNRSGSLFHKEISDETTLNKLGKKVDEAIKDFFFPTKNPANAKEVQRYIQHVREVAALIANQLDAKRKQVQRNLFWISFIAAFFLHLFTHWSPKETHSASLHSGVQPQPDHHQETHQVIDPSVNHKPDQKPLESSKSHKPTLPQLLFGACSILLAGFGIQCLYRYRKGKSESTRHDYRGLAEGLRVQLFWNVAGLGKSVPGNYLQRQRGELDWIRIAIRSIAAPYDLWKLGFNSLTRENQIENLKLVRDRWICSQKNYFNQKKHENDFKLHNHFFLGYSLSFAGLICLGGLLLYKCTKAHIFPSEVSNALGHFFSTCSVPLISILFLFAGADLLYRYLQIQPKIEIEQVDGSVVNVRLDIFHSLLYHYTYENRILPKYLAPIIGFGCAAIAFAYFLAHFIPNSPDTPHWLIIIMGNYFVGGALLIAYAEKSLYAEHARQYRNMAELYDTVDRRSKALLCKLNTLMSAPPKPSGLPDQEDDFDHTINDLQNLYYQIGIEALGENAEWLILHRSHPMEPVLAG